MKALKGVVLAQAAMLVAGLAVLAATSGAHFFSASGDVNDGGALVATWDEAGVGNETVAYTLDANASATYACINGGGNHPKAANKETKSDQVTTGGTFEPRNGRVTGLLTTGPLSAGDFSCPSGQRLVLACVSYSGITLTDNTNGVSASIDDASRTFVPIDGC